MKVITHYVTPPANWDQGLMSSSEAGFCQSTYWGKVMKRIEGAVPIFLEVIDSNDQIMAMLMILQRIPWDRYQMKRNQQIKHLLMGKNKGWLEWLDGPIFFAQDGKDRLETVKCLLNWVDDYTKKNKLYYVSVLGLSHASAYQLDEGILSMMSKHGYVPSKWATYLVDLNHSEDDLLKNLNRAAIKNIKKREKMGCEIRRLTSFNEIENFFYKPYCAFEEATGRKVMNPIGVTKILWEEDDHQYYQYYAAITADGEVIGTLAMYIFNGVATEIASSISPQALEQKIPAQDFLHWHLLLEAKRLGCHTFDLAGVAPQPANAKEEGIRRFKAKWGGEYVEYYQYNKIRHPVARIVNEYIKRRSKKH